MLKFGINWSIKCAKKNQICNPVATWTCNLVVCVEINNCTNKEGKGNCVCTFSMEGRKFEEEKKSSVRIGKK